MRSVNGIDRNSDADETQGELMNIGEIEAGDYGEQWEKYRRLWIYWVAIFAGFVPVVMALTIASSKILHTDALFPYIGGFWAALWIFSGLRINAWQCPRCRKCFIGRWWYGNAFVFKRCAHCGLPRPKNILSVFRKRGQET